MEDFEEEGGVGEALLLKSRLEALTRVLKKEVEDDTRFEKLLDALTSYLEVIDINNKQRHYTSTSTSSSFSSFSSSPSPSSSSREGERDEGEGKVKRRLDFLISNGFLVSLRQGLEHGDSRVKSISLRLLGRFSASHLLSFRILEEEEGEKKKKLVNLLERLLVGCLKDEEMEEDALIRDSSLVAFTSLLSSPWGLDWFLTKTQPPPPPSSSSSSSSLPSLCDRLLFRAFKAFDDPSKFVSNSSVGLLSTLVNGICHSMSTTICSSSSSSSSSSASSFLESHIKTLDLISKLLEQHLFSPETTFSAFPSSDSKQHSLSLLMSLCRLVFRAQEEGQNEKRRILLHFLSLRNLIPRSFLLVRDSDRFVRSNAVELISVTTQSRCYSLFLASVSVSSLSSLLFTSSMLVGIDNKETSNIEGKGEGGELETSKFVRDEVVRWLLLREGNQRNILTALSVVACSSFLHNSSAVLWKQKLFHRLCVLSLSLWFPSSQTFSLLLEDERLNSCDDPEENQLLSIMNVSFFSKMKTGLLHSLLEIAHLFISVDNLALPQFWVCTLPSFLHLIDLRDDIRFQRSSVSLLKKCVHQSLSNTTSTLVEQLLITSPSLMNVIKEIISSTSDASLVLDLLRLLFELLQSLAQRHNDLTSLSIPSESIASLPSFISKLMDTLLKNSDWEMRDSGIEFLAMFLEQRLEDNRCSLLLLRSSETWGFVETILDFGRSDFDSGVKASCLVALMQLSSNKLGWSTIMEDEKGVELGTRMETETRMEVAEGETEASKKIMGRRQKFLSLIMDSLSDNEELVRRAAVDALSELLKNDWGLRFLLEASTGEVLKLKSIFQSLFQDEDWEVKLRAVRILFSTVGALFDPSPEIEQGGEVFSRGLLSLHFFLLVEGDRLVIESVKDEDRVPRLEARKRAQQLLRWCSKKEFTKEEIGIEAGRRIESLLARLGELDLRKLVVEATTEALYGVDDQFILDEDVDETNNQMDCY